MTHLTLTLEAEWSIDHPRHPGDNGYAILDIADYHAVILWRPDQEPGVLHLHLQRWKKAQMIEEILDDVLFHGTLDDAKRAAEEAIANHAKPPVLASV